MDEDEDAVQKKLPKMMDKSTRIFVNARQAEVEYWANPSWSQD